MANKMQDDGFPGVVPARATLYLASPSPGAAAGLQTVLDGAGLHTHAPYPGVVAVHTTADKLREMSDACAVLLSLAELEQIKCRLSIGEPSTAELMRSSSLAQFCAWIDGQWLGELLRLRRLVTFFQPIVRSCAPGEVFAYECLLRGKDEKGRLVPPDRLFSAARATGQLQILDQAARLTAIESASNFDLPTNVFINFNPRSIDDPVRCLESTVRATALSGLGQERFVFEVVESEEIADVDSLLEILEFCRDAGCRVALDDLGAGYSSLNLMARLKPDFVKLDVDLIRDVDRDLYKSRVAAKLLELAKELNVATVVEGVETAGEWQWAAEHGADYAQGYLFAHPEAEPPMPHFLGAVGELERGSEVILDDDVIAAGAKHDSEDFQTT